MVTFNNFCDNKYVLLYNAVKGKGNIKIFSEYDLNILLVGKRIIEICTRNWKKHASYDLTFSKNNYHPIHKRTDAGKRKKLENIKIFTKKGSIN